MAPRPLSEQVPASAAQREEDDSGSPPPSAPWSDDAFDDDEEEGEWTPVFPKEWGQKKNDLTAGKEDGAVMEAAAQLIALSTAGIMNVESSKAGLSATVTEDQIADKLAVVDEDRLEAESIDEAEDQYAVKSTATVGKKEHALVPIIGKNHKRNQKRKNKKKGIAKKRVEHLVEGAASGDHKEKIQSNQVEDATGDVWEANSSPIQIDDTYNDVASLDASLDVVAKDELCSEQARSSIEEAESLPTKTSDTNGDVTPFDASPDGFSTAEMNSEPACASDEDDATVAGPQKPLRADSMMGDMSSNPDPSEMSKADQAKELCATNEDDEVFPSVEETVVSNKKQGRNARRNKKRSLAKKNKKATMGSTAVVSRLSITEGHKLVVAFLAGMAFAVFVTYILGNLVRG